MLTSVSYRGDSSLFSFNFGRTHFTAASNVSLSDRHRHNIPERDLTRRRKALKSTVQKELKGVKHRSSQHVVNEPNFERKLQVPEWGLINSSLINNLEN